MRHLSSVDLPTLGGPMMATTIGGGSSGARSTFGICCFLVMMSAVLQVQGMKCERETNEKQAIDCWKYFYMQTLKLKS